MPVTAKLSKEFYDKFGNAVADELVNWFNQVDATYRSDLRELNELNFARSDAKTEQRMAELRSDMDVRFAELRAEMVTGFAELRTELRTGLARLEGGLIARIGLAEGRLARVTIVLWVATLGALTALIKL